MKKKIQSIIHKEKNIIKNIAGAFLVKGLSMILSLVTLPAYLKYFNDNDVLGIWFTMLSVISWITMFDFGIGNGLRNKLAEALTVHDDKLAKSYISSSYVSITVVSLSLIIIYFCVQKLFNWNSILNISTIQISPPALRTSMNIIIIGILLRFILSLATSMIYAIQKSAINNFIVLITNLLIFLYVSITGGNGATDSNLIHLSYAQMILTNLPLLVATIILFIKPLKGKTPSLSYFDIKKAKAVLNIGVVLLWLQVAAMIVLSTHAFLITRFVGPSEVVEYNIYYKVYSTIASLLVLALTPIWSAVTKAQAELNYPWVEKLYKILLILPGLALIIDLILYPLLQMFFNIWLKQNTVIVSINPVIIMSFFNIVFVLHNVNTSVNNGLSNFKTQNIWMGVAAVLMIPLTLLFCKLNNSWTSVVLACCISILPYEIIQPFQTIKYLRSKAKYDDFLDS